PSYMIQVGTGGSAERFTVEQITTTSTPHRVLLTSEGNVAHPAGTTVTVLARTLLRAVRTVGVTYSSIADKRDTVDGTLVAGRAGRTGTRGLDY
ncbi:hypothetical protein, partial [Streptomyces brasiliscabiei]|uniref:hypothetical protein n=1 Tax=Streptomyces brasiliscabiei TaxID=2736302 RepID=UPI00301517E0